MNISLHLMSLASIKKDDIDLALKNDKFRIGVEYEFLIDYWFSNTRDKSRITKELGRNLTYEITRTLNDFSFYMYNHFTRKFPEYVKNLDGFAANGSPKLKEFVLKLKKYMVNDKKYYEFIYVDEDITDEIRDLITTEKNPDILKTLKPMDTVIKHTEQSKYSTALSIFYANTEIPHLHSNPVISDLLSQYIKKDARHIITEYLPLLAPNDKLASVYARSIVERIISALNDSDFMESINNMHFNAIDRVDWSKFPYKHEVSDIYHGVTRKTGTWTIETDSSLGYNGVEIISPALTVQNTFKSMQRVFEFVKNNGGHTECDNHSCGLHVNISVKDRSWYKRMDYLKLALFIDEGFVWKFFEERKNNRYTQSVKEGVHELTWDDLQTNDPKGSVDLKNKLSKKLHKGMSSKYSAINLSNINHEDPKQRRIEFRYLGGDYLGKFELIRLQILKFLAAMTIAMDPDYKKEEYQKKLAKLTRKLPSN